jgi:hypothetical protein
LPISFWHNTTNMKFDAKRLAQALKPAHKFICAEVESSQVVESAIMHCAQEEMQSAQAERPRIGRQIWKEGRERATASVMEARRLDSEKGQI